MMLNRSDNFGEKHLVFHIMHDEYFVDFFYLAEVRSLSRINILRMQAILLEILSKHTLEPQYFPLCSVSELSLYSCFFPVLPTKITL